MGKQTAIQWTEATWNPWHGCTKVSPGCDLCYMFTEKRMYGQDPELVVRSKTKFNEPLKWPEPTMIFTCSWSDWFHKTADEWRDEAWDIIRRTPHHTYQILTKRPGRILRHLPADWGSGYPNVWLVVSIENHDYVYRAEQLLQIPAVVRGISAEPLLGPLSFRGLLRADCSPYGPTGGGIDWVIVGGESGPGARPCDVQWIRDIVGQCQGSDTAVFVKQLGARPGFKIGDEARRGNTMPSYHHYDQSSGLYIKKMNDRKGGEMSEWPEELRIREMPA